MFSPEVYVVIPLRREAGDTTQLANVVVRGVGDQAWEVRDERRGRRPARARPAAARSVRRQAARRPVPNTGIGETMRFAGRNWRS